VLEEIKRRSVRSKEIYESWVGDRRKMEPSNANERSSYGRVEVRI
jgi:hypothetical protein